MKFTDREIDAHIRSNARTDDDSSWIDVRRRARSKAAPPALAVAVLATVVLAAPAYAFRHQLAEWWGSAEPENGLFVRAIAECGDGPFTLEFDPQRGAAARQDGRILARASFAAREIECDAPVRLLKARPDETPYRGTPTASSERAARIACSIDGPLEVAVNPIWHVVDEGGTTESSLTGSTLVVADRRTKQLIATAVFNRVAGGTRAPGTTRPSAGATFARTYWNPAVCSERP